MLKNLPLWSDVTEDDTNIYARLLCPLKYPVLGYVCAIGRDTDREKDFIIEKCVRLGSGVFSKNTLPHGFR